MRHLLSSAVASAVLLMATPAFASFIAATEDDFQSYTTNQLLPTTGTDTSGNYGYGGGAGQIFVRSDPLDASNKAASVHKDAGSGAYLDVFARSGTAMTFDDLASGDLKMVLSYDAYISGTNTNQFYASLRVVSGTANFANIYFATPSGGTTQVSYLVAGGALTASGISVKTDAWNRVTLEVARLESGQWGVSASITDKATGATATIAEDIVVDLGATDIATINRVRFYQFGSASAAPSNFTYVDNVSLGYVPVPEPASITLLLAAGLTLTRRRGATQ